MKIYTKTGDDGTTSLFDGTRVAKDDARVALYGDVDELNGAIGLAASFLKEEIFRAKLFEIQKNLFALGAKLANPNEKKQKEKADFDTDKISWLENEIDKMDASLKPMTSFILPGGSPSSSSLHMARSICRRAERHLVRFAKTTKTDTIYIIYLNRLSDYLFVAARYANFLEKTEDIPW